MKLSEMSFEDSKNAELLIAPEIEKIISDSETSELFNKLHSRDKDVTIAERVQVAGKLVNKLIHAHWGSTCKILSVMNNMPIKEIKAQPRADANAQIADMVNDGDLASFFISSDTLAQAALSVTSEE